MKWCVVLLAWVSVWSPCASQQPNSPQASLRINGQDGPSYPVLNTPLALGAAQSVRVQSAFPNAPFILFGAVSLLPLGAPVLGGELLDVDISSGLFVVLDANQDPAINTGPAGDFQTQFVVSAAATVGTSAAVQTIVADPSNAPFNASLSAAFQVTISPGITVIPLAVGLNSGVAFSLVPYGLTFPFYATSYTQFFVNEDGNVTFGAASTDFTPTAAEFQSGLPRIAGSWTDLVLQIPGASIVATVDETPGMVPTIRIDYTNLGEWGGVGGLHTFSIELTAGLGDIRIIHDPFNIGMVYAQIMGIGPGFNLVPPGGAFSPARDLSSLALSPVALQPNEAIWEWFGPGSIWPAVVAGNPWDMVGRTVTFTAVGAGAPGASYFCN